MVHSNEAQLVRAFNVKCTKHDRCDKAPSIFLLENNKDDYFEIHDPNPQIILVSDGRLEVSGPEKLVSVPKGVCFMIPPGHRTRLTFRTDSTIVIFNLQLDSQLCIQGILAKLYGDYGSEEHPFYLLKMNTALQIFEDSIIPFLKAELGCGCYHQAETLKLFHILMGFHNRYEMALFFSPLISEDLRFRGEVLSKIDESTTVTQLNQLSFPEMHPASFRTKFQSIFGTNPHAYITNHKKKVVHNLVTTTTESFKVIAFDNGFSSQQVFIEFCKRHFGLPPGQLRKTSRSGLQR